MGGLIERHEQMLHVSILDFALPYEESTSWHPKRIVHEIDKDLLPLIRHNSTDAVVTGA